jgi:hypothetical protein
LTQGFKALIQITKPKNYRYPKNVKKCDLTENQKNGNKKIAQERIFIENSISGMKRYRTLVNKIRFHLIDLYDEIIGVCAGLWNFYLDN